MQPRNDTARFERLFEDHHAAVLGYALRRCDSPEDAADAIADVFAVAWRRLDDVPAGDAARWWLYSTAHKSIANARRSTRRRDSLVESLATELSSAVNRHEHTLGELSGEVRAAMDSLGPEEREILALSAWEELKPHEIAGVLGIGRATARTRLHRARKRFADALERAPELATTVPSEEPTR
ncbi:MAG: RNA polymerase sigma factor [Solirubrobacterales bacterium]